MMMMLMMMLLFLLLLLLLMTIQFELQLFRRETNAIPWIASPERYRYAPHGDYFVRLVTFVTIVMMEHKRTLLQYNQCILHVKCEKGGKMYKHSV